jgi:hypothetical protein
VFIHNKSLPPSLSQGIYIKAGEMTFISVKRKFKSKYPWPYSHCMSSPSSLSSRQFYDFIISSGYSYRQQDCIDLCIQKQIITECKCYFLKYKNPYSNLNENETYSQFLFQFEPCLNLTESECVSNQLNALNVDECTTQMCPLECDTIEYDASLSSATSPTLNTYLNLPQEFRYFYEVYFRELKNQTLSYNLYQTLFVSFSVYYSSMEYEYVSETPNMGLSDLFVQIGASLGMFISFSVFTFVEIAEILIRIVYVWICNRKSGRKKINQIRVESNNTSTISIDSTPPLPSINLK